jgi:hypothetical protein
MKKLLVIALLMASTAAYAADATPAATAAAAPHGKHYTFDEKKAWHLKRVSEHIAELQKAQSCYEAAKDEAGLKACNAARPHHGRHHGRGKAQGASEGTATAPSNSQ